MNHSFIHNNILQNNINALAAGVNEPLAAKIIDFLNTQNFTRFELGEKGNIFDIQNQVFIYENMQAELEDMLTNIIAQTPRYPFICLYGIANGLLVKHLAQYYQHIFIFESEIELFILALSLVDMSQELFSGRIYLLDTKETKLQIQALILFDSKDIFEWIYLYELFIGAQFYNKYYQDEMRKTNAFCLECVKIITRHASIDNNLTLISYENALENAPLMFESIPYQRLLSERKNQFNSAIIVSAGPSLSKQLPLLSKMQDKAVIFAADGALKSLQDAQIRPDYVLNIDFSNYALKFFDAQNRTQEEIKNEAQKGAQKQEFLAFLSISTHPDLVKTLEYKCVALSTNDFCKHFRLSEFGHIETGTMVSHCAYTLALELGFENIIAIGQDLAFDEAGNTHAKGYAFGQSYELEQGIERLSVLGYGGEREVLTHRSWNDYRIKLEYFFACSANKARFINATEGGARIAFMQELSFKEVCEQFLTRQKPKFEPLKPLTKNRAQKFLAKFKENLNADKMELESLLENANSLKIALNNILNSGKELPLSFLQNVYASIERLNLALKESAAFNDGIFKPLNFKRGKALSEVILLKIADEALFYLKIINAYHLWLDELTRALEVRIALIDKSL